MQSALADALDNPATGVADCAAAVGVERDALIAKLGKLGDPGDLAFQLAFAVWGTLSPEERDRHGLEGLGIIVQCDGYCTSDHCLERASKPPE